MIHSILAANLYLIGIHIALAFIGRFEFHSVVLFHQDLLLTVDRGYPEMFNYLQLAALAGLLLYVFVRTLQSIYAVLGVIFLFALADDALRLHQQMGSYLEGINLPAPALLGAHHFGQLLHFVVIGVLSIAALIYSFVGSGAEDRKVGSIFVLFILMLGFCAAVLDAIHVVLAGKFYAANLIFDVAEDGGEMLSIALALSTALLLVRHLDDLRRPGP